MAYIWSPTPGQLVSISDGTTSIIDETVVVTGDPADDTIDPDTQEVIPAPDPNQFVVSGLDPVFTFSTLNNTFTIYTNQAESLFPILLTYLQTKYVDSINTVNSWGSLPANAEEIIKMETTASSPFSGSFDVTASVDGNNPETVTYSIEVKHSYSANQTALTNAINDRR